MTKCAFCKSVIDFDEEGGHIYQGKTVCPTCEANDEEV
jgi:hypothetical protein